MGDKNRSEFQKRVKNTLLSGASHGFPFESFQGSSLLIPVSQDSPSVLNDSAADVNKLDVKELGHSEPLTHLAEAVGMTTLEGTANPEETKNPPQAVSQGYAGIFSSFFGGGGQKKAEPEWQRPPDQVSPPSTSSSPRSSSPFVTVQSFSPELQVPVSSEGCGHPPSDIATGTAFSHSSNSPFSRTHRSEFETVTGLGGNPVEVAPHQKLEFPAAPTPKELAQPESSQIKNFFNDFGKNPGWDLGIENQDISSNLGFETFYNPAGNNFGESPAPPKAQSTAEPVSGAAESPSGSATSLFGAPQVQGSGVQFYQPGAGSVDSFKSAQQPPPLSSGPPLPMTVPPMSSGTATRNYRRDHHKRLTYAQVPGLTSNRTVSSSYLQPCEAFRSASSSALTSPLGPAKPSLVGSFSQPSLSLSGSSSETSSSASVHSFFPSPAAPSTATIPQPSFNSVEAFNMPTATVSSVLSDSVSQNVSSESFSSSVTFNNVSPVLGYPPPSTGPHLISSASVHPPIMSTKEESPYPPSAPAQRSPSPAIIPPSLNNLANLGSSGVIYRPVYHHWFFRIETKDLKEIWQPFSMTDSLALEQAFNSELLTPETVVPTDGGRYDVNVTNRMRTAVYWEEEPKLVRRCSWFYKNTTESRLHPYDENVAYNLEDEYKKAVTSNSWGRKVDMPTGEYVVMYGPSSIGLYQNIPQTPDGWEAETDYSQPAQHRAKIVKRGVLDDFEIDEGEPPVVDHLIFVVHGIGSVCDLKFRTIEEAGDLNSILDVSRLANAKIMRVDDFRSKSLQLIKSHFRTSVEQGLVNRVEILPVSWHNNLHGEATGVDKKLQTITLKSIPRLRSFTNDTLLDILFYTSPVYCQNIVEQVGREVNTLFAKFKSRNPNFKGGVSLVGHSLGSLILFDMLCHQKPPSPRMENIKEETKTNVVAHEVTTVLPDRKKRSLSRNVSYVIGNAGTGQPFIEYPQLKFHPLAFFAMGSPIGMFVTVRGIDSLGLEFCLPTCSRFFNIFHPFDPVAYRVEALINPELADKRPVLIPHHKGRKRMHLELKETMARVGADLKQRLVDSVRSTWNTVYQLTMLGRADDGLEQEVDQVIEKQLERQRSETVDQGINESEDSDCDAGRLNQGRRIDYVLQEAPLESFTEYVSAFRSHTIYWDSEDTLLLILAEIYGSADVSPDSQQGGVSGTNDEVPSTSGAPENLPSMSRGPPSYGFK